MEKTRFLFYSLFCFLVLASVAVVPWPGAAQALYHDAYVVRDVPVNATGSTASQARQKAMAQGQAEAYRQVIRRIRPGGQVPVLDAGTIEALVSSMEVRDEKIAPNRYQAVLDFQFDAQAMQQVLLGPVVKPSPNRPATIPTPPVGMPTYPPKTMPSAGSCLVVLPVWKRGKDEDPLLWEEHAWRVAWERRLMQPVPVSLVMPRASLQDMSLITAGQAVEGDYAAIMNLTRRYQCAQALVVSVGEGYHQGKRHFVVERHLWSSDKPVESKTFYVPRSEGDAAAYVEAIDKATGALKAVTPRVGIAAPPAVTAPSNATLLALIPLSNLDQWVDTRRKLTSAGGIRSTEIRAMSDRQVDLELQLVVPLATLAKSLMAQGLQLEQQQGYVIIRPQGPPQLDLLMDDDGEDEFDDDDD